MLFNYDLSVLIDVLLLVGTIVAAYCQQKRHKSHGTRSQKQQEKKHKQETKEPRRQMPQRQKTKNITFLQNIVVVLYF